MTDQVCRCERQFTPYPPSEPYRIVSLCLGNTVILALNINIISGLLVN